MFLYIIIIYFFSKLIINTCRKSVFNANYQVNVLEVGMLPSLTSIDSNVDSSVLVFLNAIKYESSY